MPPCRIAGRTLPTEEIGRTENSRAMFVQTCAHVYDWHASEVKPHETTGRGRGCDGIDRLHTNGQRS
jgi:hypothetical protein